MPPFKANLVNGIVLIALGLWGYLSSDTPSTTALIPVAVGVLFLIFHPGMKKENKIIAHIVVLLTLLLLIALYKPLSGALERGDSMAQIRIGIMMIVQVFALIIYVKSFIDARKNK